MTKKFWSAHNPIAMSLAVIIFLFGFVSVVTFKAVDATRANSGRIEASQKLAREAQDKLDHYQTVACERGNVLRAYLIIRGDLLKDVGDSEGAARNIFHITACDGPGINQATSSDSDAYLSKIAKQMGVSAEWRKATAKQ